MKEAEMASEQDRYLRNKLSDDSGHLVKENALLNQQVIELTKQNERVCVMQGGHSPVELEFCGGFFTKISTSQIRLNPRR